MISICGCAINSKYEVESLLRTLSINNQETEWELCVTLDNRVDDGSLEHFTKLQKELVQKYIYYK